MRFDVPGIPVAKGRPRFSRFGGTYTPKKTADAEKAVRAEALKICKKPIDGPLALTINFVMPIPKSLKKTQLPGSYHIKRPDVDNLAKLVMDSLNGICWHDDSQVSVLSVAKSYGQQPTTIVDIVML